jgi:hypothetical protein
VAVEEAAWGSYWECSSVPAAEDSEAVGAVSVVEDLVEVALEAAGLGALAGEVRAAAERAEVGSGRSETRRSRR